MAVLTKTKNQVEKVYANLYTLLSTKNKKDDLNKIDILKNHNQNIFEALANEIFKKWARTIIKPFKDKDFSKFSKNLQLLVEQKNENIKSNISTHLNTYKVYLDLNKLFFNKIKSAIEMAENFNIGVDYMISAQKINNINFQNFIEQDYPGFLAFFEKEEAFIEKTINQLNDFIESINNLKKNHSSKKDLFNIYKLELNFLKLCDDTMNHISNKEIGMGLKLIDVSKLKEAYSYLFEEKKNNLKGIMSVLANFIKNYIYNT